MQASRYKLDASLLPDLVDYDPETGVLRWKARVPAHFPNVCEAKRGKVCAMWNGRFAGAQCFNQVSRGGYRKGDLFGRYYRAHHVAWALVHSNWPTLDIDHIDGDPTNNRIGNLRLADATVNARNRGLSAANKSGVMGVHWDEKVGFWIASVKDNHQSIYLGRFATLAEAAACRIGANRVLNYHENHGKRDSTTLRMVRAETEKVGGVHNGSNSTIRERNHA